MANAPEIKECELFSAPFDVRLPEADEPDETVRNVVQPDIVVICDPEKIDERGCRGAPDFIIEIISPHTAVQDRIRKADLYEKHGVKEYWIVDPIYRMVTIRLLGPDGRWRPPRENEGQGFLEATALPGLTIDLNAVFPETVAPSQP